MDWTKIKVKHFLFADLSPTQKGNLVTLLCLTAQLEAMPSYHEMIKVVHWKSLIDLQDTLKTGSRGLQEILKKVLEDVQGIETKRMVSRETSKRYREKKYVGDKSHDTTEKRRVREEKSISNRGFKKPERQEVKKHFTEIFRMPWEADKFYDFYESKGWFVGKNKMKVWKSAASNWSKNAREKAQRDSQPKVVERPDRSRNNASSIAKSPNSAPPVQHCDPPPPEFRQMIDKLASEKGVS